MFGGKIGSLSFPRRRTIVVFQILDLLDAQVDVALDGAERPLRLADDLVLEFDLLPQARNLIPCSLVDHVVEIGHDGIGNEIPLLLGQLSRSLALLARRGGLDHGILLFMIRLDDGLWHWILFSEFIDVCFGCGFTCGLVCGFLLLQVGFDFCHGLLRLFIGSPDLVVDEAEALLIGCLIAPLCFMPEWLDVLQNFNDGVANWLVVFRRLL